MLGTTAFRTALRSRILPRRITTRHCSSVSSTYRQKANLSYATELKEVPSSDSSSPVLGVLIDIDGVVVRGPQRIPAAQEAIEMLFDNDVPFLFLTNSGCETEKNKADFLSSVLDLPIQEEHVVLSHSPIRLLTSLHNKNVVVSGQGPVTDIAKSCGFKNVYSVEELIAAFPFLNTNDRRRVSCKYPTAKAEIPQIEAVILMGEPISWEAHMQIILDILVSDGRPNTESKLPGCGKHVPVIAVNTDFLWMGEAPNPRFGNGAFLLCLESLYQKLTGVPLNYTGILGKPSLFTYEYSTMKLLSMCQDRYGEDQGNKCIFAIGDNLDTDIYGANLFNALISGKQHGTVDHGINTRNIVAERSLSAPFPESLKQMHSILVRTGVSQVDENMSSPQNLNHLHRDMPFVPSFRKPNHVANDLLQAVELVCDFKRSKESEFA